VTVERRDREDEPTTEAWECLTPAEKYDQAISKRVAAAESALTACEAERDEALAALREIEDIEIGPDEPAFGAAGAMRSVAKKVFAARRALDREAT